MRMRWRGIIYGEDVEREKKRGNKEEKEIENNMC